jgi:hypothetical protein
MVVRSVYSCIVTLGVNIRICREWVVQSARLGGGRACGADRVTAGSTCLHLVGYFCPALAPGVPCVTRERYRSVDTTKRPRPFSRVVGPQQRAGMWGLSPGWSGTITRLRDGRGARCACSRSYRAESLSVFPATAFCVDEAARADDGAVDDGQALGPERAGGGTASASVRRSHATWLGGCLGRYRRYPAGAR